MAIEFREEGDVIRVLRGGVTAGQIFRVGAVHHFHKGSHARQPLGHADFADENLERLKATIRAKYARR